jgi:hypothetical protein
VSFDESFTIREFVEKPAERRSNWACSRVMLAGPGLLDTILPTFPLIWDSMSCPWLGKS